MKYKYLIKLVAIFSFLFYLLAFLDSLNTTIVEFENEKINLLIPFLYSLNLFEYNFLNALIISIAIYTSKSVQLKVDSKLVIKRILTFTFFITVILYIKVQFFDPKISNRTSLEVYSLVSRIPISDIPADKFSATSETMSKAKLDSFIIVQENKIQSEYNELYDLLKGTPDSIIKKKFKQDDINEYGLLRENNKIKTNQTQSNAYEIKNKIKIIDYYKEKLRKTKWEIIKRSLIIPMTILIIGIGLLIGLSFSNQSKISIFAISIVVYYISYSSMVHFENYYFEKSTLIMLITNMIILAIIIGTLIIKIIKTGANKGS